MPVERKYKLKPPENKIIKFKNSFNNLRNKLTMNSFLRFRVTVCNYNYCNKYSCTESKFLIFSI